MLKKIFRRVRKGIRDVASTVEDNPLAVIAGLGLGFGSGMMPGGAKFGLGTLFDNLGKAGTIGKNLLGRTSSVIGEGSFAGNPIPGEGFLGGAEKLLGGLGGIKSLLPFVNAYIANQQYKQEREDELREQAEQQAKLDYVTNMPGFDGRRTGGSDFAKDRFEIYQPFKYDSEGRIIESADGGIAKLNMGGNPYQNNMMKLPVRRAMGGESTGVPGLSANMSSDQMMNKIKDNPGITAFFPPKMGMISGPGGPKDDKIPAMLSDGEFVFTAKAVDNAGGPRAMYKMMNKLDPESSKGRGII
jgi:hypothetical protein